MDFDIGSSYKMTADDWDPLIDAMKHLSHLPECGDVAKYLYDVFVAAKEGRYYYIEMACDGREGANYISNTKPADQVILKIYKFIQDNSPLDGDCPPGREMSGPICRKMLGNCELCIFDAAVESVMKE